MTQRVGRSVWLAVIAALVAVAVLVTVALVVTSKETGPVESEIFVKAVEGLPEDFALGVDVSSVLSLEESGVIFRDAKGNEADLFRLLAQSGVTDVRIRVWNDPFDAQGRGFGGGNVDVARAVEIGKRATDAGLGVLVDFHYSDFWADPAKQMAPRAWENMSAPERAQAAGDFTREALTAMRDAGVRVTSVQVGNETNNGVAGLTAWDAMCAVFSAGAASTREVFPDALVVVHFTNPEREGEYERYAKILNNFDVDYDVFASSYYPFWHGTTENLTTVLSDIASTYGKKVMVAETSWVYSLGDFDGQPNVVSTEAETTAFAVSAQGQADAFRATVQAVADVGEAGIGVYYWEPAWLPVGPPESVDANRELWERDGSGWATSFAGEYDPDDAGQFWGGSGWDNQALFAADGTPLASLRMFEYVRKGAIAPLALSRVEAPVVDAPLNGEVTLPGEVTAHYNDGTSQEVSVAWGDLPDTGEEGEYAVTGTLADGTTVTATVRVRVPNLLTNPGFEDEDLGVWALESDAETFRVVSDNVPAAMDQRVLNFWSGEAYAFTVEQTVTGLEPGTYLVQVSVHGSDVRDADASLTLTASGSAGEWSAPLELNGWQAWFTGELAEVTVGDDGVLSVAVHGEMGPEDWGFVDGFVLTPVEPR